MSMQNYSEWSFHVKLGSQHKHCAFHFLRRWLYSWRKRCDDRFKNNQTIWTRVAIAKPTSTSCHGAVTSNVFGFLRIPWNWLVAETNNCGLTERLIAATQLPPLQQIHFLLLFSKHRPSGPMLSISRVVPECVCVCVCLCVCVSSLVRYHLTFFLPTLP